MNEIKKKIIEAAAALLTEHGFHGTAVQDITARAGISKGAFYLHFKSKEALYIEIFHYYYTELKKEVEQADDPALAPSENYRNQLEIQIRQFMNNTSLITMYIREQAFSINEQLLSFIRLMHTDMAHWYTAHLTRIYGEPVRPFVPDIATLVEGVKNSYMQLFIANPEKLDPRRLTDLLIWLTEQATRGFLAGEQEALLDAGIIEGIFTGLLPEEKDREAGITEELSVIRSLIGSLSLPASTSGFLSSTADFLENQAACGTDADPQAIQGALAAFKPYPEFSAACHRLSELLGIPLL